MGKKKYIPYDENGRGNVGKYKRLQVEKKAIGWDNLLREKYSKRYANKQEVKTRQEEQRQKEEDNNEKISTTQKKKKSKTDNLQVLFTKVSKIIHELWLERNTDRHNPTNGQLRIAKIMEPTREVEYLYSLRSMVMPEYDSRYYAMKLSEMTDQSHKYMLRWANRWKRGIFHRMKKNQNKADVNTILIWKIWNPTRTEVPTKVVDRQRSKWLLRKEQKEQSKLKGNPMTNIFQIDRPNKSTSKATQLYQKIVWNTPSIRELVGKQEEPKVWHQFEEQNIEDMYGDGFHK